MIEVVILLMKWVFAHSFYGDEGFHFIQIGGIHVHQQWNKSFKEGGTFKFQFWVHCSAIKN